jgi:hypothetical protein
VLARGVLQPWIGITAAPQPRHGCFDMGETQRACCSWASGPAASPQLPPTRAVRVQVVHHLLQGGFRREAGAKVLAVGQLELHGRATGGMDGHVGKTHRKRGEGDHATEQGAAGGPGCSSRAPAEESRRARRLPPQRPALQTPARPPPAPPQRPLLLLRQRRAALWPWPCCGGAAAPAGERCGH